jgi:hypothetical protein
MILFARQRLGNLDTLPEVIAHWRKTGAGSITPMLVSDAVAAFQAWQLPRVKARTASDSAIVSKRLLARLTADTCISFTLAN